MKSGQKFNFRTKKWLTKVIIEHFILRYSINHNGMLNAQGILTHNNERLEEFPHIGNANQLFLLLLLGRYTLQYTYYVFLSRAYLSTSVNSVLLAMSGGGGGDEDDGKQNYLIK